MTEFERRASALWQQIEKLAEDGIVTLECRRQLKEQYSEFRAQGRRRFAEDLGQLFALLQLGIVRNAARRFQGEGEILRCAPGPSFEQRRRRHAVERVVHFDGVE